MSRHPFLLKKHPDQPLNLFRLVYLDLCFMHEAKIGPFRAKALSSGAKAGSGDLSWWFCRGDFFGCCNKWWRDRKVFWVHALNAIYPLANKHVVADPWQIVDRDRSAKDTGNGAIVLRQRQEDHLH